MLTDCHCFPVRSVCVDWRVYVNRLPLFPTCGLSVWTGECMLTDCHCFPRVVCLCGLESVC